MEKLESVIHHHCNRTIPNIVFDIVFGLLLDYDRSKETTLVYWLKNKTLSVNCTNVKHLCASSVQNSFYWFCFCLYRMERSREDLRQKSIKGYYGYH